MTLKISKQYSAFNDAISGIVDTNSTKEALSINHSKILSDSYMPKPNHIEVAAEQPLDYTPVSYDIMPKNGLYESKEKDLMEQLIETGLFSDEEIQHIVEYTMHPVHAMWASSVKARKPFRKQRVKGAVHLPPKDEESHPQINNIKKKII